MPPLRPRIGIEEVDRFERSRWHPGKERERVAGVEPDIVVSAGLDQCQNFCHAVDEGLAADEAEARMRGRLRDQMLAAAKPDLKPRRFDTMWKQCRKIVGRRVLEHKREPRQQVRDQRGLVLPQRPALAAAEKGAVTRCGATAIRRHERLFVQWTLPMAPRPCRRGSLKPKGDPF